MQKRYFQVSVTPTVSSGAAYSANDQVGGIQTIPIPDGVALDSVKLHCVHVVDSSSQSAALTLFLFNTLPTVASSDNAALNISDAEMVANASHVTFIAAASYGVTSANTMGGSGDDSSGHPMRPTTNNVYAVVATTGTPTYTSTTALTFKYMFEYEG